jgi:NDP-sugar pyrophosphorylase family protein
LKKILNNRSVRDELKALILAGGKGLRLRKVVSEVPKPMASVAGKPFLEYLILQLVKWKFKEIVLSIGYKGDRIKSYFGKGTRWGVDIRYSEEEEPLGTAGAIRKAADLFDQDQFLVMNGDSFLEVEVSEILLMHRARATLGLGQVEDVSRYGQVAIDENGKVLQFIEKGSDGKGLINGGVYVFSRKIIDHIPPGKISLEREVLPSMIEKGLYGSVTDGFFVDIGFPQDYLALCRNHQRLLNAIS